MTKQERQQRNAKVINLMKQGLSTRKIGLRLANIQLNQELLAKVVKVVDLVNEKGGKVSVEDIVKL